MQLHEQIQPLVDALPPEATVILPVSVLRRWMENTRVSDVAIGAGQLTYDVDLTIPVAAQLFGRGKSTIRSWCTAGLIPGCYRLRGREWRIPREGLSAFLQGQQNGVGSVASQRCNTVTDLAAWRNTTGSAAPVRSAPAA